MIHVKINAKSIFGHVNPIVVATMVLMTNGLMMILPGVRKLVAIVMIIVSIDVIEKINIYKIRGT